MKKIIGLCILLLCLACNEDESFDPTIMPEITLTGEKTFGCLVDGWLYSSGRWGTPKATHKIKEDNTYVEIVAPIEHMGTSEFIDHSSYIRLTLVNPKKGETVIYTDAVFEGEKLENGKANILRMDNGIISGTFEGTRMTNGRFDLKYLEEEEQKE